MLRRTVGFVAVGILALLVLSACNFGEYAREAELTEGSNVDAYRTGCEIDAAALMAEYKQYDANRFYYPGYGSTPEPTPTPGVVTDTEIGTQILLETVWENGCQTGRRDAVGADQATLMALQDQLTILAERIAALEPTPTPSPTPTP